MKYLALVLRWLLGGIFVVAGVVKIIEPAEFAKSIGHYRILSAEWINLVAITLPWIEVLAGGMLMVGIWKRANSLLIAGMMIVFLIAIGQAVARNLNIDCGCFGTVNGRRVGLVALGEDTLMLATAVLLTWWYKD